MTIIIANLIIGLTVSNIIELSKEAYIYKLGETVKQIKNVELFTQEKLFEIIMMTLILLRISITRMIMT